MGRSPCCAKEGLNRGAWTAMEDKILTEYIKIHGEGKWRHLPKRAGLKRCGKSCRLRWLNYLRPDIKRGNITHDEEELIIRLHKLLGNRWSLIAGRLPGRTDNEIKNYWNTNIGKKLQNGNPVFSANPAQQHPNPKNETQKQDPNPVNLGSCIVRTKAKRCTKVVITKEPQQLIWSMPKSSISCDNVNDDKTLMGSGSGSGSGSDSLSWQAPFVPEGSNPLDFMADFEMDGNFLSDLLKTDFSESFCFETNVEDSNASTSENNVIGGQLSPRSNETCLYSDDALHGKEFQSMSTLAESEFDWL